MYFSVYKVLYCLSWVVLKFWKLRSEWEVRKEAKHRLKVLDCGGKVGHQEDGSSWKRMEESLQKLVQTSGSQYWEGITNGEQVVEDNKRKMEVPKEMKKLAHDGNRDTPSSEAGGKEASTSTVLLSKWMRRQEVKAVGDFGKQRES